MFQFNKERALNSFKVEIRERREPHFQQLDIQFMRAVESGNTTLQSQIAAQKQTLRDLTDIDVNSFETQSDLISLWPTNLLGECPFK
jgi:hypothetical protein